jgi:glycosyltransferase involved in cell wall biosynthesis
VIYLAWFILTLAFIQFTISLVNLVSSHTLPAGSGHNTPLVSVLIPARDEENNIANVLLDLIHLPYQNLEILVYDDESTDNTEQIVREFEKKDPRIRYLDPIPLPAQWTGKNHGCHRLSLEATGDYYLFLDADVRVKGPLIENALNESIKANLSLISIFPVQLMKTPGERISVPLMHWILLSLLPLPLIRHSKRPSLAAANGQFMFFPSPIYEKFRLHQLFKGHMVEDVAITGFLKTRGEKVDTFLGNENISCRMYHGLKDAIEGFTKNIFQFFGNSILLTLIYALLITSAPVIIFAFLPVYAFFIYIIFILMMRVNISLAGRQPVFQNLAYLIPQQFVFLLIIVKAVYNHFQGKLIWKGRNISDV